MFLQMNSSLSHRIDDINDWLNDSTVIEQYNVVSAPVAAQMALGAAQAAGADIGISVTGVAGPTGGDAVRPVGTVYLGAARGDTVYVEKLFVSRPDRALIRARAAQEALVLALRLAQDKVPAATKPLAAADCCDAAALEALIDCYAPYVCGVAARILPGRPEEWEELAGDVFLAAWDNRKKLRPGQVKGWLSTVARNRAFNRRRGHREDLPLEEDILLLQSDLPQSEAEYRELRSTLSLALGSLDQQDRELFVRHYYYGQTVARAAEEMELNLSTAKTRLRRGRERLKRFLQEVGYEPMEN